MWDLRTKLQSSERTGSPFICLLQLQRATLPCLGEDRGFRSHLQVVAGDPGVHPLRDRSVALVAIGGDSRHSGRTGRLFGASLQEPSPMKANCLCTTEEEWLA